MSLLSRSLMINQHFIIWCGLQHPYTQFLRYSRGIPCFIVPWSIIGILFLCGFGFIIIMLGTLFRSLVIIINTLFFDVVYQYILELFRNGITLLHIEKSADWVVCPNFSIATASSIKYMNLSMQVPLLSLSKTSSVKLTQWY